MKHHELRVVGKKFAVEVRYLDRVTSRDGRRSILDAVRCIDVPRGLVVLFLEARLVFNEDLVVRGVFHAIKDKIEHGVVASDNPAINVLMHIFGTNQIDLIKQEIIPSSYHDPGAVVNNVAMVLVSGPDEDSSIVDFLSGFRECFSFESREVPAYAVSLDPAAVGAWMLHKDASGPAGTDPRAVGEVASARMAIFSLALQQKGR